VEPSNTQPNLGPEDRYEKAFKEFNTAKDMLEATSHQHRRPELKDEDIVL